MNIEINVHIALYLRLEEDTDRRDSILLFCASFFLPVTLYVPVPCVSEITGLIQNVFQGLNLLYAAVSFTGQITHNRYLKWDF